MSVLNNSVIKESQIKSLKERVYTATNSIDINYLGFDCFNSNSKIALTRDSANTNRVLFWLSTKKDDYIRESFKGGVLYSLLGVLCNTTNLTEWEKIITEKFNDNFSNDLQLLYLKLTVDKNYKKLTVNMIVKDIVENSVFTVATEASV